MNDAGSIGPVGSITLVPRPFCQLTACAKADRDDRTAADAKALLLTVVKSDSMSHEQRDAADRTCSGRKGGRKILM